MSDGIDIFSLIEEATRETDSIIDHPAKHWPLEEKLLYLQGLALISMADGKIDQKEKAYLQVLIKTLDMDEQQTLELLENFAKHPDKDTVKAFFVCYRQNPKAQLFLFDALGCTAGDNERCENEQKVLGKMVEQLAVSDDAWEAVNQLFGDISTKNWQKSLIPLSNRALNPEYFRHLYHQHSLDELLLGQWVTIPAGSFIMGSNDGCENEKPAHNVTLKAFLMQEHTVTFEQWDACFEAGACSYQPSDAGLGRQKRPVINVSYNDITQLFIPWLNRITGKNFRLPSEAEWEYACRAGTTTRYSLGNDIGSASANFDASGHKKTLPVKSYPPNAFGLYDMHGNVWEWVQDCYVNNYKDAPANGAARLTGGTGHVLRGGSWNIRADDARSAYRHWSSAANRANNIGFRLVQDC